MDAKKDEQSLPDGPRDLCFSKHDFLKTPFSVDEFLQNHRKNANLEIMRDDLGIYLKVLRSAMIELINKDYADFVNLSSNLIGLDKAITKIHVPLGQLKEEVWLVKSNLDEAIIEVSECLEKQRFLQRVKRSLHSLTYVKQSLNNLSSLLHLPSINNGSGKIEVKDKPIELIEKRSEDFSEADLVERISSELNKLQFKIGHCEELIPDEYKERLTLIKSVLMRSLDRLFLRSISNSDISVMKRCLCIYESLGKEREAEELFRKQVVAKELHGVISEASVQSHVEGLKGVYKEILSFIDLHMKDLLELTSFRERPPVVAGFFFLVNSYWPEVEQRLELHTPSIFAPGNPDNFFQNYSATQNFLSDLEQKCGSQADVKRLHLNPQYLAFHQLWNLPVYFQIRFQEIGGGLETALNQWSLKIKATDGRFHLSATQATWQAGQLCWSSNIFLLPLAHRFWKLTLQVFARYHSWTGEAIKEKWTTGHEMTHLSFLVWLFCDINTLVLNLPQVVEITANRLKTLPQAVEHCKDSIKETADQLKSRLPAVTERIVSEVASLSAVAMRQVSDIPRLFRRTNRDVPTKPCSYVNAILGPLQEFSNSFSDLVGSNMIVEWLTLICSSITCQFYACVSDVLTSVQKTEESLRRLKKMRDRGTQAPSTEGRGLTDDDKIRMQLSIDVNVFIKEIEKLGVKTGSVERLGDLSALVETAAQLQQQAQS